MSYPENLRELRHYLHSKPDLSGGEAATAAFVASCLENQGADRILTGLGGHGLAALFRGRSPGPRVLLRAELDGLPIEETGEISHISKNQGVAHACGHDGHMAILLGVAARLASERPARGEVVLLFQPAEETGQGALEVLSDQKFSAILPQQALALHNIPGHAENEVILRRGCFAFASVGMNIVLEGKTAHAGYPEQGISPVPAISEIIRQAHSLSVSRSEGPAVYVTIIHVQAGEPAYGTSPGRGRVSLTFRSSSEEAMRDVSGSFEDVVRQVANNERLSIEVTYTEPFPVTHNSEHLAGLVAETALGLGMQVRWMDEPFRWSEDFGHFSARIPSVLFGLGSGRNHPALHHPDYDFNDSLLEPGVQLMDRLSRYLLSEEIPSSPW